MRSLIAILIFALALSPAAAATYRWVDGNGNVHYSDTPHPGAQKIVVPKAQTYAAPQPPAQAAPEGGQAKPATGQGYKSFAIVSPTPEQTLWNIGGQLTVQATLAPGLRKGDQVQFFYDGKAAGAPGAALSITLRDVYRGSHTVSASVLDADGKPVVTADAVLFYVKQHSILKPH